MPLPQQQPVKLSTTTAMKEAEISSNPTITGQPAGNMLEAIAKYRGYGQALKQTASMREIAARLAEIADIAEQAVVNEADDWFDQHTVKRNMKEIKGYSGDFAKLAQESDMINQRMAALYEDMGRVLDRYFDLGDEAEDDGDGDSEFDTPDEEENNGQLSTAIQAAQSNEREVPSHNPNDVRRLPEGKDAGTEKEAGTSKQNTPIESPNLDKPMAARSGKLIIDDLTLKAIKSVHERLKREGKTEFANRFAKLPPKKMKECVWRIIK